jgi:hypothetical protein
MARHLAFLLGALDTDTPGPVIAAMRRACMDRPSSKRVEGN